MEKLSMLNWAYKGGHALMYSKKKEKKKENKKFPWKWGTGLIVSSILNTFFEYY